MSAAEWFLSVERARNNPAPEGDGGETYHSAMTLVEEAERLLKQYAEFVEFVKYAPVSSGVCCCGDNMAGHSGGMQCGHSARDQWDYSLSQWLEKLQDGQCQPTSPALDTELIDAVLLVLLSMLTHDNWRSWPPERAIWGNYAQLIPLIKWLDKTAPGWDKDYEQQ